MSMIAIGGAIGTGVFLTTGKAVSNGGSGSATIAFLVIGFMMYLIMTQLGEMATAMPVSGSWSTYAGKFVDPAFGFGIGWNSWFSAVITIPTEITAANILLRFWLPDLPLLASICISLLFLGLLLVLNIVSAGFYGESEFWFAGIKVVTCAVFIIVGILTILGVLGGNAVGFGNWTVEEAPFVNGFSGLMVVMVTAGFAFQGSEYVGITAGESENPSRDVPRAINSVFWRILIFYVGTIVVISFLIPYTDPNLLAASSSNVAMSPYTIVFERAGLAAAASVVNAVLLTSVLSAGNTMMYGSSRMLYALASEGKAPRVFSRTNARGIPINALLVSVCVGLVSIVAAIYGDVVLGWLVNISAATGFVKWLAISSSHYRFRKAWLLQGHSAEELPYRAKWYPYAPFLAFTLTVFIFFAQVIPGPGGELNWSDIISTYCGIPVVLVTWLGYKIVKRTRVIALKDIDLSEVKADRAERL
ncbi:amino acid permease [Propionibacterium australiense]|nr:amino acid permease [Propionibacterium australiense]SYZ32312.1 Amino acid/polyamine transporter I [Propionibacterium australiense]VEH90462.1 Lysine-specific permease [Propionibacterium australiense]